MKYLQWLLMLYSISELGAVPMIVSWTSSLKLLDTEDPANITTATDTTHISIAVDYHFKRGEIYYSDGLGRIYRFWMRGDYKGKDPIVIVEVLLADGLAVDWQNDNLYWADLKRKTVEMATLDGLDRRVLFDEKDGVDKPRAVVVDPSEGLLFWSDWGSNAKVLSSGLDGTEKRTVSSIFLWPNGLTLDLKSKTLYILDGLQSTITSCNYDGSNFKTLLSSTTLALQAFGLTYYANTLYWSSWKETALLSMNVQSQNTAILYKRNDWKRMLERMMGLKVIHDSLQPESPQTSPCDDKHCSHGCLLGRQGTASCVCPFGFDLNHDRKTCDEKGYLLVSWRSTIRRYNLKQPIEETQEQPMIDSAKAAISIDYHYKKGLVFWSDVVEHRIYRAPLEQLNNKTVVVTVETCDGLAVDWVHDVLYWTNEGHNTLEAASLDGSNRTVLVSSDLDQPRDVALDPLHGLLFWTDWGTIPKIERADLDGSNRNTIINSEVAWPNGLTIDFDKKKIYWVDGNLRTISSCLYDGSERSKILVPQIISLQPFGISKLNDNIYWTDWGRQSLFKTSTDSILGRTTLLANSSSLLLRPNGVAAVHSSLQKKQSNPCDLLNCKSLCIGSPSDPRKARCMGEEAAPDVVGEELAPDIDVRTKPEAEANELDSMTLTVGNDSFQLSMSGVKINTLYVITLKCNKREGCSEDKKCSEGGEKTQVYNSTEAPFTMTGLLPATKYDVRVLTPRGSQEFHMRTKNNDPPQLPMIKSVIAKRTHVTIQWDPVDTCVPNFEAYNYKVYKINRMTAELEELVSKESTNTTEVTVQGLEPDTNYTLHLYTSQENQFTSVTFNTGSEDCEKEELMCDGKQDCKDGRDEDIDICAGIDKITVYKKTKSEAFFRCDVTNRTAKNLEMFSGNFSKAEIDDGMYFNAVAKPCVVWPTSFCFHLPTHRDSGSYIFRISAHLKDDTVGKQVLASVFTKEGVPGPPEDLHVVNYTSTDVELQWRYPNQSNGIIRNFIINIQEVESFEEDKCCLSFPMSEIPVEDEQPTYYHKAVGLSPASTYAISITSKTLYMGGSKEIDVHTPPPPLDILRTPEVSVISLTPISWQPRGGVSTGQPQYQKLIKSYILILMAQKADQKSQRRPVSELDIGPLRPVLETHLGAGFSVLWNKNSNDSEAFKEPISVSGLTPRRQYQLAWVQVSQYKQVYGIDYILSEPFIAV